MATAPHVMAWSQRMANTPGPLMPGGLAPVTFPTSPLKPRVMIALSADPSASPSTWLWEDITRFVRWNDGITVTDGRPDQSSTVRPGEAHMTLNNRDGRFSRRNPMGAYYGKLSKNTPIWIQFDPGPGQVTIGEMFVNEWPTRWDRTTTDSYVTIVCAGVLRRVQIGAVAKSALSRTLSKSTYSGLLGWWPFENVDQSSTSVPSGLSGGSALTITDGSATRSTDGTMAGSAPLPKTTLGVGAAVGASNYGASTVPLTVDLRPSTGNSWSTMFWTRTRLLQDSPSTSTVTVKVKVSGSPQIDTWFFTVRQNNFSVAARVEVDAFATDTGGTVVSAVSFSSAVTMPYVDGWRAVRATVDLSGTDHRLRIWLDETLVNTVSAASNTPGQPSGVYVQTQATTSPVPISFGQLLFAGGTGSNVINDNATSLFSAGRGYAGETAAARIVRMCQEENVPLVYGGSAPETTTMGAQPVATFLDVLRDAEKADQGVLYEKGWGLGYQSLNDRYNQPVSMALDFAQSHIKDDPQPADDDQRLRNRWVVTRTGGLSYTASSASSIAVDGVYEDAVTINVASDSQLVSQAQWRVHATTVDEDRWPGLTVKLHATPGLIPAFAAMPYGARITASNPPSNGDPNQLDLVVEGRTISFTNLTCRVVLQTSTNTIYGVYGIRTDITDNLSRIPAGVSTLDEAATSGQTRLVVTSVTTRWIDTINYAAQFPFDIIVSGERMRVTASANYLNANPYFESPLNTSSWTSQNGATLSASGAQFHQGAQSLLVTPDGSSFVPQATSEEVPAVAGRIYTVTGWIRSTGAATRKLGIFWYDASHSLLSSNEISIALSAGVWTQYGAGFGFTAPAGTAFLRIFTNDPSNPLVSNTWFLDEVTVTSGSLQVFTVTRSINGIVKSQTAGTAVQLFRPPVIAR